ncbi:hypothetical protein GCM10010329_22210 [Streptomyces spiroverticillatus]|uniref:Uncharacterized protein n=1 Tax=Streptomyces finlayi TaxID=67296 RepID=A0A918WUQ3_9ACTN|nr:hypothetical protein GCM10010329_22210 [Streptomyces spiroverticillatus]GHC84588.1 hypothetical protein GCM10010334_14640 [Streptomyces finlayi]
MGAGAVALCLGGLLAVGGDGGGGKGFVAVGAAGGGPEGAPTRAVPPEGSVELFPLDAPDARGGSRGSSPGTPPGAAGSSGTSPGSSGVTGPGGAGGATAEAPGSGSGGRTPAGETPSGPASKPPASKPPASKPPGSAKPPSPAEPPEQKPPASPAALTVGTPVRAKADRRWCEKVTVRLRNTGGTAVRSGTVTFATHIIGALGVDWGTRTSTQPLPGRIDPGEARNATYTVCVDAWRVPLGMHVETRKVSATWK